jgi:hypothetical protein
MTRSGLIVTSSPPNDTDFFETTIGSVRICDVPWIYKAGPLLELDATGAIIALDATGAIIALGTGQEGGTIVAGIFDCNIFPPLFRMGLGFGFTDIFNLNSGNSSSSITITFSRYFRFI